MTRCTIARLALLAGVCMLGAARLDAQKGDARWEPIRRAFGQTGETEDGYFRIELPRSDLHVSIGSEALDPEFEFTSYLAFVPVGARDVLAMGEIIMRDDEAAAADSVAAAHNVQVTALHNHLIGESPRIIYMHVMAEGFADSVASELRAIFAKTATPMTEHAETKSSADWSAIDAVLGPHTETKGARVAEYVFPRHEQLSVHGRGVKSSGVLETASEVVFQQLGAGQVANTGELFLLPREVQGVVRALERGGLHVTAVHNHMLDESPTMYWVHWYGTGQAATVARTVAQALAQTNGARKAAKE